MRNRSLLLTILEAEKTTIKAQYHHVLVKILFLVHSQTLLLCLHLMERGGSCLEPLLTRTNPIHPCVAHSLVVMCNSMKLRVMTCRTTQDRWVLVESSDKTWSTGRRNGKPLQYSCCENPGRNTIR